MRYLVTILEVNLPKDEKILSKSVKATIKPLIAFSQSSIIHFRVDKSDEIKIGDTHEFTSEQFTITETTNDNGIFKVFEIAVPKK